jgi:antitoxin YefM
MEVLNYSELRKNLAEHLNTVSESSEVLIVARGKGKNVVFMSLEDYNSLIETVHLLSTTNNSNRLNEAIEELKSGKSTKQKLSKDI